jgi:signal transduction histidine kinase/ActR/RegA family two-component response regulator
MRVLGRPTPASRGLRLAPTLLLALAYFVTGRIGLHLAVPPGYATAIWLPSGIALAGILILGGRSWPSIWLGSFLVNIATALPAVAPLRSFALAGCIGVGASLQALAGAALVRRFAGFPTLLDRERDVLLFLLMGGPVGCVVGATFGVTSLLVTRTIPASAYLTNWGTWWIGDTIGVIVVAPVIILFADRRVTWRRRFSLAIPLSLGMLIVATFLIYASAREAERVGVAFRSQAQNLATVLRTDIEAQNEGLHSVQSLFQVSRHVDPQQFRTFVEPFFQRHRGLRALSWIAHVPRDQRRGFEQTLRESGRPGFRILERDAKGALVEAADRDEYAPVVYIEPLAGNESAIGFDLESDADRRDALAEARVTGALATTGPLRLVQETGHQRGVLVAAPIFDSERPDALSPGRRPSLKGYGTAVIRVGDMLAGVLRGYEDSGIEVSLFDVTKPGSDQLLGRFPEGANDGAERPRGAGRVTWRTEFEMNGRRWALSFAPSRPIKLEHPWQAWAVLVGGLFNSALLGAFLLIVTGRAATIEALVVERTIANAALRERERLASMTAEVSLAVAHSRALPEMLRRCSEAAVRHLDAAFARIWTLDPTGKILELHASAGMYTHVDGAHSRVPVGKLKIGQIASERRPLLTNDILHDQRIGDPEWARREGMIAFAGHPLLVGDELVGVMALFARNRLSDATQRALGAVSDAVALGIKRKRAEEAQAVLEEQLRQSQKLEAVGQLAGGIAHDFNNLLTVVTGYTELLLSGPQLDEHTRSALREVNRAGERAASLTRQLLAFSRRQILQPKVLDLNAVVSDMSNMIRRLIGEHIHVIISLAPDLGRAKADPGQIEQVILNLAVNARDAMPGGGRLTIETSNCELNETYARSHPGATPGPCVLLAMIDTGTGMSAEVRARLFEPFFTTKEKGKGTGLGLATVYGIVRQSRGYICVDSAPGQGASFKIYLPRVEEEAESEKLERRVLEPRRGTETILVVEDEVVVRRLLREVLVSAGYRVLESESPGDGVRIAQEVPGPIELMITDVVMPGMSGREIAEQVLRLRPNMAVLYISGYTDDAIVKRGVLELETAFLQKPFTPGALLAKVRDVLDAPRQGGFEAGGMEAAGG